MIFSIKNGKKSFKAETLFSGLDFYINPLDKIAVIGSNGAGKTTLLKIITDLESLDSGEKTVNLKSEIGYLSQTVIDDSFLNVHEYLDDAFSDLKEIQEQLNNMEERMAKGDNTVNMEHYALIQSIYQQRDGYNRDYQIANVFTRFGFKEEELDKKPSEFSGGQRTKLAFVKLLLKKPELLLLDEPTNHLDLSTIEWLENYLKNYPFALVIVSHDRYFIDHICNVTYELENKKLIRYNGNYSYYQESKKLILEQEAKLYKNQKEEIIRLEKLIEKFRYKKNKAAFAQSKIKYLERMDRVELTKSDTKTFKAKFEPKIKGGKTVCILKDYEIGYDQPLAKVNLIIESGQRIGVIGHNGTGKSTLLKSMADIVPAISGEKHYGHQISIGYFDQQLAAISSDNSVIEELWKSYPNLDYREVRSLLGRFLFSGDDVFKEVKVLSGGEKVRLAIAKLLLKQDNFLLLDEPTNHLDIKAKEALELALLDYTGTILFVSHDRYFISHLANALLIYKEDNFVYYPLSYKEYREKEDESLVKNALPNIKDKNLNIINPLKEISKLEKQITKAEEKLLSLQALTFQEEYYLDSLKQKNLQKEINELKELLESLTKKWENLH